MLAPMPVTLALVGLLIGFALYVLLVRRRAAGRMSARELASALTASNQVALMRLRNAVRHRAEAATPPEDLGGVDLVLDRRSGKDRRGRHQRSRGRGRRCGGDRRRSPSSR
jgi:hypothetical protein